MSGCAHMSPADSCAACAPEKLRAALASAEKAEAELARRPSREQLLEWRGIASEDACRACDASGHAQDYGHGARNQTLDDPGPCRACWGTGSILRAAYIRDRIEKAETNYRFMVEHAADAKLDGYRALGERAAAAEERAEKAEAERDDAIRRVAELNKHIDEFVALFNRYLDALTVLRALYARLNDEWDSHLEHTLRPGTEGAADSWRRIRRDVETP
jgi:hypothetical protein